MGIGYNPRTVTDGLMVHYDLGNDKCYNKTGRNIVSTRNWSAGMANNVSIPNFGVNGDGNSIIDDTDPWGNTTKIWDVSNQDAASDADGGWNSGFFKVDITKTYRFSVWIRKKVLGDGSTYWGPRGYNAAFGYSTGFTSYTGSVSTNPYFHGTSWPGNQNQWYLFVGFIFPYGTTPSGSPSADTGVWDLSGTRISNMADWIWPNDIVWARHRAYMYYSTNTSTNQQFYDPRVYVVDGSEPTLAELLAGPRPADNTTSFTDMSGKGLDASFLLSAPRPSPQYLGYHCFNAEYGDNISIPNWNSITPSDGYYTIEMFARVNSFSGGSFMMWGLTSYDLYCDTGALGFNTGASDVYGISSTRLGTLNLATNWAHYVFVVHSQVQNNQIWINGVQESLSQQVGTTDLTATRSFTGTFKIGGWGNSDNYTPYMDMSQFRMYNRKLSASEIASNFQAHRGRFGI